MLQIRIALLFVRAARTEWDSARAGFGSLAQLTNRASQLKPNTFKFPWTWVYVGCFAAILIATFCWFWIHGLREAMAPEPEERDPTARQ
ncbi:MAG: hypothetical protein JWM53_2986 [bacterium]|nr:hypothetical protein [bacterium]